MTRTLVCIAINSRFGDSKAVSKEQTQEYLVSAFNCWDADGNGTLSEGELRVGLETMGVNLSRRRFKLLLREVDHNRDSTVDIMEFCSALTTGGRNGGNVDDLLSYVDHMYEPAMKGTSTSDNLSLSPRSESNRLQGADIEDFGDGGGDDGLHSGGGDCEVSVSAADQQFGRHLAPEEQLANGKYGNQQRILI